MFTLTHPTQAVFERFIEDTQYEKMHELQKFWYQMKFIFLTIYLYLLERQSKREQWREAEEEWQPPSTGSLSKCL